MSIFTQLLINGLIAGAIYSLVASGFSLVYFVNKFIYFAHGTVIAFNAYMLYFFFSILQLNFFLSVFFALLFSVLFGYLVNILYKQFRKRGASTTILLISSVGLLIFLESLIILLFGASVKTIGFIKVSRGTDFLGAIITPLQIFIIFSSLIILILLFLFIKKTKIGKGMRAVSDNKDIAEAMGISSERIYKWTFIISSFLAGVTAVLVGLEQNLDPTMGTQLMIKGLAGTIVGGIGSIPGAILGSFFLGIVENFGIWFLPSGYKDAISFTILFLFLLFRPQGIMGFKKDKL